MTIGGKSPEVFIRHASTLLSITVPLGLGIGLKDLIITNVGGGEVLTLTDRIRVANTLWKENGLSNRTLKFGDGLKFGQGFKFGDPIPVFEPNINSNWSEYQPDVGVL